ncbi:MAG: rhomboid family intramembrane serine protease [Thermotogae bacterium]|nr:rhomboid family intramembrane serine protease [Thermotogota bacterium]
MFPIRDDIPSRTVPLLTWLVIVVSAVIFLFETPEMIHRWGFVPARFWMGKDEINMITYAFLHGNIFHIFGNMYYLYIFGDNVEDRLGKIGFVSLFITSAILGAFFHALAHPHSTAPLVGASGAISGILAAYMIMYPNAGIYTAVWWWIYRVPAYYYIGLWIAIQYAYALSGVESGVAWWAHVGGFVGGIPFGIIGRLLKDDGGDYWDM